MATLDMHTRIIKYYIVLALERAGVQMNGDIHAELDEALGGLEEAIRGIVHEEIQKANCGPGTELSPALAGHRWVYQDKSK